MLYLTTVLTASYTALKLIIMSIKQK